MGQNGIPNGALKQALAVPLKFVDFNPYE